MERLVTQDKSKFAEDSVNLRTRREQRKSFFQLAESSAELVAREAENRKLTLFMGEMCKKNILNSWFVQV